MRIRPFIIFLAIAVGASACVAQASNRQHATSCTVSDPVLSDKISVNVVNVDVRDVMLSIYDQFGCDFIVDKTVGEVRVSVFRQDIPWKVMLEDLLRSKGLDWMTKDVRASDTGMESTMIYVASKEKIRSEIEWWRYCFRKINEGELTKQ